MYYIYICINAHVGHMSAHVGHGASEMLKLQGNPWFLLKKGRRRDSFDVLYICITCIIVYMY